MKVPQSCLTLWPHGLYNPWNSPRQNTGVGSLSLLEGLFPTRGSKSGLQHCRWIFTSWVIREGSSMHWFSFLPPFLLFWANYWYRCQWEWGRNSWMSYLVLCLELSQMLICPHPTCHKRVTLFFLSPLQNISVHVRITPPYPHIHTRYLPAVIEPPYSLLLYIGSAFLCSSTQRLLCFIHSLMAS